MNRKIIAVAIAMLTSSNTWADETTQVNAQDKQEQVNSSEAPVTQMESMQIRVKAEDKPAVPANVPSTTESVTSKQIAESVNSVSSAGALLYLPSVHVRERFIGDVNGGLAIRGYGVNSSAETIVYADGLLLSNFLNNSCCPGPRWGIVPQNAIDRVDVMYGPFSALYPGNSVGGVVLMKTHMPEKFEAHAKFDVFNENFKLYGTDENFTGVHGAATIGNKINDFSFWLSADHLDNHSHPTDFTPASLRKSTDPASNSVNTRDVTGAYFDNGIDGKPRVTTASISADHTVKDDFTIKLGYDFTPTLHGTYTFDIWQNDSDKKSETYLRDLAGNKIYGTSTTTVAGGAATDSNRFVRINGSVYNIVAPYMSHGESEYVMHGISLKTDTGGRWDWEMIGSYFNQNKDFNRQSSGNFGITSGEAATAGTLTVGDGTGWYNVDLRGEWRPSGDLKSEHQVSFGVHTDTYTTKTDVYTLVPGTNWQTSGVGALSSNSRGETSTTAIYLQDAWQISPNVKLVIGGREEKWQAKDGSNYANGVNVSYPDKTVYAFSPKASLSYQATDDWSLKTSYGRGVRFPTVNELFKSVGITAIGSSTQLTAAQILAAGFPAPYNVPLTNNTNLKPETADSWEFTAERLLQNGVWRTSVFGEEKQDALISQADITTLPGYSFTNVQNIDKVRTYGIETALQTSDMLINRLDLSGSVAYIHSRIVSDAADPRYIGSELPLVPVWRASMLGVYHASDKLSYSLGWRYSGRQHSGLYNPATQVYPDPNPGVYGGRSNYSVFDAKVLYKLAKQWSASVGIDNITNEKYFTLYPYAQRTFFAGAKFDY